MYIFCPVVVIEVSIENPHITRNPDARDGACNTLPYLTYYPLPHPFDNPKPPLYSLQAPRLVLYVCRKTSRSHKYHNS